MNQIIRDTGSRAVAIPSIGMSNIPQQQQALPLTLVLWRRRWTIVLTIAVGMLAMLAYLKIATPIYSSTGKIAVSQITPKVFTDHENFSQSETFLQTQADIFLSTSVLKRALESADPSTLAAIKQQASGDLIEWLRQGKGFKVEAARKSDLIMVTMESADKFAAYKFVQNMIDAYRSEQAADKKLIGTEMLEALSKQRNNLATRREQCLNDMLEIKTRAGVYSMDESGRGNSQREKAEKYNRRCIKQGINRLAWMQRCCNILEPGHAR